MGQAKKILRWSGLAAALSIVVIFASPSYRQGEASLAGKTAPEFTFERDGKQTTLSNFRSKVVVLNFWATWCPPCVEETPSLNRLQQHIGSRGGTVLGISVDEDSQAYEQFLRNQNIVFPTFRDPTKKISLQYGTSIYPETYIIDREGRIARKIIGPQNWDSPELITYLDTLLSQS
ncbi:MAG TPA: TlpA disulfide reductase family protein [Candidatus Dormibacteraeota bacterium]|nr:TlpA disulfide reductase family protein [Candidatus Dormibacteraeota bacterium]